MEKGKFYFGAATSAHQVEGNNHHSDWWKFEHEVQKKDGFISGKADNHYELFDKDFALAKDLGHDCHRFSIEWAKVEPEEGKFDEKVLDHYHEVFKSLKQHGLTPFVTLWHFTLPLWFSEKGGFEKKENIFYFVRYCKKVAEAFKDEMEYIFTINELSVYLFYAYLAGKWPPQKKSFGASIKVFFNLVRGHKQVYEELKEVNPNFKIGVATNNPSFSPDRNKNIFDRFFVQFLKFFWNHFFIDCIKRHQDFIGLNYYFHRNVRVDMKLLQQFFVHPSNSPFLTDNGWEIYPRGIAGLLKDLWKRYRKPIVISENGLADKTDHLRAQYIHDILDHIFNVKNEGVHVFGYMHWSLMDNFEWAEGFDPRFGLVEIHYDSFVRKPRPSAYIYKQFIEQYRKDMK